MQDKRLISSFVLSKINRGITNGSFLSTILLADMSGFTSLTDKAMQKGAGGAEWISDLLSFSFTPLIDFVELEGGSIVEFEGDSALAVFPGNKPELLEKAKKILKIVSSEINEEISFTTSIAFGRIYWGVAGVNGVSYQLFYGDPIAEIFNIRTKLPKQHDWSDNCAGNFHFYPSSVAGKPFSGEFRTVYSTFVSLGVFSTQEAQQFFNKVCELTQSFDGFLSGTYLRGTNARVLVVFGVPKAHESDARRVGEFLLSLSKIFPELSAGITSGTAYVGFVGSKKRCDYTVQSTSVNLASRLCSQANSSEILLNPHYSELIFPYFLIEKGYVHNLKGYDEPQASFKLVDFRSNNSESNRTGKFIGREKEKSKLIAGLNSVLENQKQAIVNILGEPGIGKTRLLTEFRNSLSSDLFSILLRGDELLFSRSLYPWRKAFFNLLEADYKEIEASIQDPEVAYEFTRAKKYIGLLTDSSEIVSTSLENISYSISVFLEIVSSIKPILFCIEDSNYLDIESTHIIQHFLSTEKRFGCLCLTTSRDYSEIPACFLGEDQILLEPFSQSEAIEKLSIDIDVPVQEIVAQNLYLRSSGNPLYLEQLSLLVKQDQLEGTWTTWQNYEKLLPSSLASLLESIIDNLDVDMKRAVVAASVLGSEFDPQILRHMLPVDSPAITKGLMQGLWKLTSRGRLTFRHQLLRETIYNMQLVSFRKKIHRLAVDVILKLYSDPSNDVIVAIALHSANADYSEIALKYLEKAADYCRSVHQNQLAIDLYLKFEHYAQDTSEKMRARGKRSAVLEVAGRWQEALELLEESISIADNDSEYFQISGRLRISLGKLLMQQGRFSEATTILKEALTILDSCHESLLAAVYANLGGVCLKKHEFEKALSYLNRWVEIVRRGKDKYSEAMAMGIVGALAEEKGEIDRAREYYILQKNLGREVNQPFFVAISYLNLGELDLSFGNYESSRKNFEKSMKIYKKLGNRSGESLVSRSLGKLSLYSKDYKEALRLFYFHLNVSKALGKRTGLFAAYRNIFEANLYSGDIKAAEAILAQKEFILASCVNDDIYTNMFYLKGLLEIKKRNFVSALKFYNLSLNYIQKNNMPLNKTHVILTAFIYFKTRDFASAKKAFKKVKGVSVSEEIPIENQIALILKEVKALIDSNLFEEIELALLQA